MGNIASLVLGGLGSGGWSLIFEVGSYLFNLFLGEQAAKSTMFLSFQQFVLAQQTKATSTVLTLHSAAQAQLEDVKKQRQAILDAQKK